MQGLTGIRFLKKFRRKNQRKARFFYMDVAKPTHTAKVTCEPSTLDNQLLQKKAVQQSNNEARIDIFPDACPLDEVEMDNV